MSRVLVGFAYWYAPTMTASHPWHRFELVVRERARWVRWLRQDAVACRGQLCLAGSADRMARGRLAILLFYAREQQRVGMAWWLLRYGLRWLRYGPEFHPDRLEARAGARRLLDGTHPTLRVPSLVISGPGVTREGTGGNARQEALQRALDRLQGVDDAG